MKGLLICLALASACFAADLPDAPSKVKDWHVIEPTQLERISNVIRTQGPTFFQFRKGPDAPPFPNRNVLHSKAFWMQAGFMVAAEELARTRTHSESEPWAAAGVMGFSYLGYRMFSPCFTLGMTGSGLHWLKEWAK
jgi:hypothetical protein